MNLSNVRVIFGREVRDQARDRRTLFMIFVLPILLYPMLVLGMVKMRELFHESPRTVVIVGAENLRAVEGGPDAEAPGPPLLDASGEGFNPELFVSLADAERLRVRLAESGSNWTEPAVRRQRLRAGEADVVVILPPDLGERLRDLGRSEIPIYYNSAGEKSQNTFLLVDRVIERWRERIVESRREREGKPEGYTAPVRSEAMDVATRSEAGSTVWARLFPFLLVMMALTGAFYPAVDICAGEKERGTMETLLISPASRGEIVAGKFFTVMLFSIATAMLNLLAMGLTALQLARIVGAGGVGDAMAPGAGTGLDATSAAILAPPTFTSAGWMILLLIPLSAFFSAICLALAVMARSMKEGQYYMTPLYLVALPLIFLTLMPGVELNLLTSLIPITGASLLLKALMLGDYQVAVRYFPMVMAPILVSAYVALRWAVDQFNRESVLFREAERFDLLGWLRHVIRDRGPRPSPNQALLCFLLMLMIVWAVMPFLGSSPWGIGVMQILVVATPAVLLAFVLTSDPAGTLLLRRPKLRHVALGIALALTLHPLVAELRWWVELLFPTSAEIRQLLEGVFVQIPNFGVALLLFALAPAVCEELAFRGFILSGLKSWGRARSAIVLSALLFGFLHVILSLFQQLFNATLLGLVLGLLAVRSGSLLPGVAFHFVNNALALVVGTIVADESYRGLTALLYSDPKEARFHTAWLVVGTIASTGLLSLLLRERPTLTDRPSDDAEAPEPLETAIR